MPASPSLSTSVTAGSSGHLSHTNTVHGIVNDIYKADVGTTQTGNFTLTQSMSGEAIQCNSASTITVTIPVLQAETTAEFIRMGSGAVQLSASGTTLRFPSGSAASCRLQYSSISVLYLTTTEVLVAGDLT